MDNQERIKNFVIQPETNNSISLFVRSVRFHLIQDNRKLLITLPEGFEAKVTETLIEIAPKMQPESSHT